MNDIWLWIALIAGEILLVFFILLLAYWIRGMARARRDKKAVGLLVDKVRKNKGEREKQLGSFLQERMGMQGETADEMAARLLREEMRLIQRFGEIYKKRDAAAAAQFSLQVDALLEPYHELSGNGEPVAAGGEQDAGDNPELARLQEENRRLSEELVVTMDTMSRMLSEYSTMFSGGMESEDFAAAAAPLSAGEETAAEADVVADAEMLEPEDEALDLETDADMDAEDPMDEPMADRAVNLDEQELDIGELEDIEPKPAAQAVEEAADIDEFDLIDQPSEQVETLEEKPSLGDEVEGALEETDVLSGEDGVDGLDDLDDLFDVDQAPAAAEQEEEDDGNKPIAI